MQAHFNIAFHVCLVLYIQLFPNAAFWDLSKINTHRQVPISTEMDGKLGAGNLRHAVGRLVSFDLPGETWAKEEQMHYVS